MNNYSYHYFFNNLANKTRVDIIRVLREKPLSVNEISKKLDLEQSKVSHNLSKLLNCSIINVKQIGKNRVYSLNNKTIVPMLNIIDKHREVYCKKCLKK